MKRFSNKPLCEGKKAYMYSIYSKAFMCAPKHESFKSCAIKIISYTRRTQCRYMITVQMT